MLSLRIDRAAAHHPAWWPENAVFAIDFITGTGMRAGIAQPLAALITFSRASAKLAPDSQGRWHRFAPNIPAITDLGILLEPTAANLLAFAHGPAGWSASRATLEGGKPDPAGGMAATRITVTGGDDPIVVQDIDAGPLAGRTFTHSVFARCENAAGMSPGLGLLDYDAAVTQVSVGAHDLTPAWARYATTFTFGPSDETQLFSRLDPFDPQGFTVTPGAELDVWNWQLEEAAGASSPIESAGTATIRGADLLKLNLLPGAQTATCLFADLTTQELAVDGDNSEIPSDLQHGLVRSIWTTPA